MSTTLPGHSVVAAARDPAASTPGNQMLIHQTCLGDLLLLSPLENFVASTPRNPLRLWEGLYIICFFFKLYSLMASVRIVALVVLIHTFRLFYMKVQMAAKRVNLWMRTVEVWHMVEVFSDYVGLQMGNVLQLHRAIKLSKFGVLNRGS